MKKDLINIPGGEDLTIPPMAGLAAVALNMALSYLDASTIKDGQMYQLLKNEGKEIHGISLETAFHYAKQIEIHLMGASERFSDIIIDAVKEGITQDKGDQPVGEFIEDLLRDLGTDRKHAARIINVPEDEFGQVLDGTLELTLEVATKLEEHFKMPASELLTIQAEYTTNQFLKNPAQ
jgi:plasmid maintenance system antidote protein VapI